MKNILLIMPNIFPDWIENVNNIKKGIVFEYRIPLNVPLGLLYLASYARNNIKDINIKILDMQKELRLALEENYFLNNNLERFIEETIEKNIGNFKPDIIGMSIMFDCVANVACLIAKKIRECCPQTPIIAGGCFPTNMFGYLFKKNVADFVIIGEGEKPLVNIIKSNADPYKKIKGVISKKQFDSSNYEISYDTIYDLDSIPFPAWDLIDMDLYSKNIGRVREYGKEQRTFSIFTTRGCPFNCVFCTSHTVHGKKLRKRSVENVIKEIKELIEKYDINNINIEDDNFSLDKERTIKICQEILNEKLPIKLEVGAGLAVNTLDETVIILLKKVGMDIVNLAIESGCQYVQDKIMKKGLNLKRVKEVVGLLKKYDIHLRVYYVLGLPGETKGMMRESIDFIKKLNVDWVAFQVATPISGSELYEICKKNNYLTGENYNNFFYLKANITTPDFTAEEVQKIAYDANIEINFLNNYNMLRGNIKKAIEAFTDVATKYPFHIIAWWCLHECYIKIGDEKKAAEVLQKIKILLETEQSAKEMFIKYKLEFPKKENQIA